MKVRFNSQHLLEGDVIDHGLVFKRGEVKDVPDDIGKILLENPLFSRAYVEEAPKPIPHEKPAEKKPEHPEPIDAAHAAAKE